MLDFLMKIINLISGDLMSDEKFKKSKVADNNIKLKQKNLISNKSKSRALIKSVLQKLLIITVVILALFTIDVVAAFGRFEINRSRSSYMKAIQDPNTLTIVYRPDCGRCKRVLPTLLMKKAFSRGKEYFIDARTLTPEQKRNLGETSTPAFVYKGEALQTIDEEAINSIWDESHK